MKRREIILGSGSIVLAATAGCSSSNEDEPTESDNSTEETESGSQVNDQEIPPPSERRYDDIHGEVVNTELPKELWGLFNDIEEDLDHSIYEENTEIAQGINREPYHIESDNLGTATSETAEGEEYEVSLVSYDISLNSSEELSTSQIESSIAEVMEITAETLMGVYLFESEEESAYNSISNLSISVEDPSQKGEVTYDSSEGSENQEIGSLRDTWSSFLEGEEEAIEEKVSEDLKYS